MERSRVVVLPSFARWLVLNSQRVRAVIFPVYREVKRNVRRFLKWRRFDLLPIKSGEKLVAKERCLVDVTGVVLRRLGEAKTARGIGAPGRLLGV